MRQSNHVQAHPDVPVVEKMEDLWRVSKLQRERKRRQEQAAALREARAARADSQQPVAAAAAAQGESLVSILVP